MQKANAPTPSGREGFLAKTGSLFSNKLTSSLNQNPWPTRSLTSRASSRQTSPQRASTLPFRGEPPDFSTDRGSISSRSSSRTHKSRVTSFSTASLTYSPDKKSATYNPLKLYNPLSTSFSSRRASASWSQRSSLDSFGPPVHHATTTPSPLSAGSPNTGHQTIVATSPLSVERPEKNKPLPTMLAAPPPNTTRKETEYTRSLNTTTQPSTYPVQGANGVSLPNSGLPSAPNVGGLQNPNVVYQNIHETSSKRISTLHYLRKSHEGRVYWFNTLLFTKSDLSKMSYFEAKKLARRATNYLLLGLSLPAILDLNASNPLEYLRALNALLAEFESYQQIHPPDGSTSSSLSRSKIPQMFKRATHGAGTKGRRTSSAADIGLPMNTSDPSDSKSMTNSTVSTGSATASSFPAGEQELLPGEEYLHLLTPSLPFDPDFYETFATLCDVLVDCYTRIMSLISSPAMCAPGIGDAFSKADARLRKVMVAGIIKEFEDTSRSGAKSEIAGIGKVVLGGLL